MIPVNGMRLKKSVFCDLGENDQHKVKVKLKVIYSIQAEHSYHYQSSIAMVLWDRLSTKWYASMEWCWKKSFVTLWKAQFKVKVKFEGDGTCIYIIPAKHSYQYIRKLNCNQSMRYMSSTKWYPPNVNFMKQEN